jgi:hypothetical protein
MFGRVIPCGSRPAFDGARYIGARIFDAGVSIFQEIVITGARLREPMDLQRPGLNAPLNDQQRGDMPPDLRQLIPVPILKRREIAHHAGKQAGIASRFCRSGSPSDASIDRSEIMRE